MKILVAKLHTIQGSHSFKGCVHEGLALIELDHLRSCVRERVALMKELFSLGSFTC
jgi:hypothetical protein